MDERKRQEDILRFWRAVELFSPQAVPKGVQHRDHRVERWHRTMPEPWVRAPAPEPHPTDPSKNRVWRHTVFLGVFSIASLYDTLDRRFEPDRESYDPRPPGHSALAAITVDQQGLLLEDSAILSGCGWATGRAVNPGPRDPRWLDGLAEAEALWVEAVTRVANPYRVATRALGPGGDESSVSERQPLTTEMVGQLADLTRTLVGFPSAVDSSEIRFESRLIRQTTAETPPADFLNSFFLDDLDLVARRAKIGDLGAGLTSYLREAPIRPRIDVRTELTAVLDQVSPDRMALGRWPSQRDHPLALSQQLAANLALGLGRDGVLAVNGPPGTGKTTLLREIYSSLLVQRADVLAGLESPFHAFNRSTIHGWNAGGHPRRLTPLIDELTGFEMVVASSNNAAVANVSQQLPDEEEIAPEFRGRVNYFAEIATALLQPDPETPKRDEAADQEPEEPVNSQTMAGTPVPPPLQGWALTAARLGRKSYRSQFHSRFWFGTPTEEHDYTAMLAQLKAWRDETAPTKWAAAVREYRRARDTAAKTVAVRAEVARALHRLRQLEHDLVQLDDQLGRGLPVLDAARSRVATARSALLEADTAKAAALARRQEHQQFRPGLLQSIFTLGRAMREWNDADGPLAEAMASADRVRDNRDVDESAAQAACSAAEEQHSRLERQLRAAKAEESRLRAHVTSITEPWSKSVPDQGWWTDVLRREGAAPWLDEGVNEARSNLTLAALTLHREFLRLTARIMFENLQAACDVVAGVEPHDLDPDALLAAWQSMFLVVPLVSTTFASYGRMFGRLGRESLGWLFIDEAGQASAGYAAGALWRTRRTLVVGDPRQLKPVVTIPPRLEGAIAKYYGVSAKWRPHGTSVQQLADEVTAWGTTLKATDSSGGATDELWVGAPLRVHRRCDQPMLDICNAIAYPLADDSDPRVTGLMIDAVGPRDPIDAPVSQWYDVVSSVARDNLVPAELEELKKRLDDVLHRGTSIKEIICISPFRDTAEQLVRLRDTYPDLRAGTIHTAQGQEADVVFLVLGGNPAKPGVKQWASAEPNLLNVAVSRAKRRLYVIGDKSAWAGYRYFDVVARELDRHAGSRPAAVDAP